MIRAEPRSASPRTPDQELWLSVIARAWKDLDARGVSNAERDSAVRFFTHSGSLPEICQAAGIDLTAVRMAYSRRLAARIRG